ncbi:DoxX family protein [Herbiconiux sp. 11R-BC]|uniref:DoxX family protein n=1 Tax=Herbiconiux sp. 11R-BC TaxID=3111637 RepID=UPI0010F978A0
MHIASVIISILLALALAGSGIQKLRRAPAIVTQMTGLGVSSRMLTVLGLLEVAAAVGLIVGIWWTPLAIAAAIGAVIYFIGAIIAHVRKSDKNVAPAAVLLVLSIATLVLLLLGV